MASIPQWWMKGDWFDVCSCNIACPCEFAQPPTNNHCDGVMAYHIREGAYGNVRLDGFSVIAVLWIDGNFWTRAEVTFGIFIDERADERQREAIQQVFSGQAGGFMPDEARSNVYKLFRATRTNLSPAIILKLP